MGRNAGLASAFVSGALGVFWLVVIFIPSNWQTKEAAAISTFSLGLFTLESDHTFVTQALSFLLAKYRRAFDKLHEGTHTISDMKEHICSISGVWAATVGQDGSCDIWTKLYFGSWMMAVMAVFASLFFFLGAGFAYHYWKHEAREQIRLWIRLFFISGPAASLLGMIIYTSGAWNFSGWLNSFGEPTSSWGCVYMLCCVVSVLSFVPIVLNETLAKASWMEEGNEFRAQLRKDEREAALNAPYQGGYGAMGGGPQMGPMGSPPPGYGGAMGGGAQMLPGQGGGGYGSGPGMGPGPNPGAMMPGAPAPYGAAPFP